MSAATASTAPSGRVGARAGGGPAARLRKAAIVLCAMPDELAARVLEHLPPDEVEALANAVAATHDVDRQEEQRVCAEYLNGLRRAGAPGGAERARALIQRAFPADEAARHLARLDGETTGGPFDFIAEVGVARVLPFLQAEEAPTLALICACTPPAIAATIVLGLPVAAQHEVLKRLAALGPVAAMAAGAVGAGLERRVATTTPEARGGPAAVQRILEAAGNAGAALRRALEPDLPDLAGAPADGGRTPVGVFELLQRCPAELRSRALGAVPAALVARALRAAPPDLGDRLLAAMTPGHRTAVQGTVAQLGPVKVSEAEQALEAVRTALGQALSRHAAARTRARTTGGAR